MQQIESAPEIKKTIPLTLIITFMVLSVAIILGGIFYYQLQRNRIFTDNQNNLIAISTLKIGQIEQWRDERLGYAEQIKNNNPLLRSLNDYIVNVNHPEVEIDIKKWTDFMSERLDFSGVFIYDTLLNLRLATMQSGSVIPEPTKIVFGEAMEDMNVRMTDLYRDGTSGQPAIDLIVPLVLNNKKPLSPFGVIVLRIDPGKKLFPLIQSWPTPSKSAETLLVRKEGDSVLYLNNLRHIQNTALILKFPLTDTNLLATKAVKGVTGVVEGIDYRKIQVVGNVSSISGLDWFMVTKIDKSEILEPLTRFALISIIVAIILVLFVASVLGYWIWNKQLKEHKEQLKNELTRKQLDEALIISETRYRRLFEAARDGILILEAESGLIVDVNPYLVEMLGLTREQFLKKSIWEIGFFKDIVANKEKFLELKKNEYVRYEDLPLETIGGRTFHVEFVSNVYEVSGYPVIQCNIRDISKRKEMEEALQDWNNKFKKLSSNAPGMIYQFTRRHDGTFFVPIASEGIRNIYGCSPEDVIDDFSPIAKVILPEDLERIVHDIEYSADYLTVFNCEYRVQLPGKPIKWLNSSSIPEKLDNGTTTWYGFNSDITEQKLAQEELRETNEYLSNLLNYANAPIIVWDTSMLITRFNHAFENLSGYSEEEVLGKKIDFLFPEENAGSSLEMVNRTISGERWETVEIMIKRKDGAIRIVLWNSANIMDMDNKLVTSTIAQGNDITERKLAEIKLREEKERIRTILDQVGDPIFVKDNDHRVILANRAFYDIFCLDEKSVIGYTLAEAVPENERHHFLQVDRSVLDTGIADLREEELTINDSTRTIITRKIRFLDGSGNRFLVGSIHDITDRKKAEEELHASENKFRQTFDLSPVGIVMVGLDKKFLRCNNSFSNTLGYKADELVGKTISDVTLPEDENIGLAEMGAIAKGQLETAHVQKRYIRIDGNFVWGDVLISLVRDNTGNPRYFLAIIQDITERKQAEENLLRIDRLLKLTGGTAKVGGWEVDVNSLQQSWTDEVYRIHEVDHSFNPNVDNGIKFYSPKSQPIIEKAVQRAIELGEHFDLELEFITAKGNHRWLQSIGKTIKENGTVSKVYGSIQDITERRSAEEKIKSQVAELERFNKIMVGRENRMIELKQEINELCGKLDLPLKYKAPDEVKNVNGNQ